jgi:anoctamin-10/anoctamin-7
MGNLMACGPSKEPGPAGSDTLVGKSDSENKPLLSKIADDALPGGKLKDFTLDFAATEQDMREADIVVSWPLEEGEDFRGSAAALGGEGEVAANPLAIQRRDMLMRIVHSGLSFTSMKSADGDEAFIIIQASEERLMEMAEYSGHEMRLKKSWQVPYACFTINRKNDFIWENKAENKIFSTRDRQTLIMRVLETNDFDSVEDMHVSAYDNRAWREKYGVDMKPHCGLTLRTYMDNEVISGYWGMHGHGRRYELVDKWANLGFFFRFWDQPLKMIFEYFNSQTALYFAFVGYYSMWLFASSGFGLCVYAYELFLAKHGHSDDNDLVAYFSFFMALWGTCFLEFWKRYNAELAYRWSTTGLEMEASQRSEFIAGCGDATRQGFYSHDGHFVPYDEDITPDDSFCGALCNCGLSFSDDIDEDVDTATRQRINEFAPQPQPYMDPMRRCRYQVANSAVALIFIASVISVLVSFLVMRLIFQKTMDASYGPILASTLQALCTVGLNVVYKEIAQIMVNLENHRTDNEWENAIINKVFIFQFINSYFSLFYIAFLKGKIGDLAGYNDVCRDQAGKPADNCMYELSSLLLSTLLTTQIASTIAEALLPYVRYKLLIAAENAKWKASGRTGELQLSDVDHESKLEPKYALTTFDDYNKMAIQFGYVSMFVAAFPLAPLCALINNALEVRTDGMKRLLFMQRPAPSERAEDIGAWMTVLELMSLAAVATNVGVLCFTSHKLADDLKLDPTQRVWVFVILEHIVLVIKLFIAGAISDVPQWVTLRLARDAYMLHSRDEIIAQEEEALKKSDKSLQAISGITLETKGAKAPMSTTRS